MRQSQLFENDSNKERIEIYKDIEFELEKLLDLRKTQKETEEYNHSTQQFNLK